MLGTGRTAPRITRRFGQFHEHLVTPAGAAGARLLLCAIIGYLILTWARATLGPSPGDVN
jgi:ABC-type enterobactin transport system permease subunit